MNPQTQTAPAPEKEKNPYTGTVTTKIDNPWTGQKIELKAEIILPLVDSHESLASILPVEADTFFWINNARKAQARAWAMSQLEMDLGDDKLNDLYNAFTDALNGMIDPSATAEERSELIALILRQKKFRENAQFMELSARMTSLSPAPIIFDFSKMELPKPSNKRGRKPGQKATDSPATDAA